MWFHNNYAAASGLLSKFTALNKHSKALTGSLVYTAKQNLKSC